jgi:ribonuclease Z
VKPVFHPQLLNDPFSDPGVYVEFLFGKRAILFDLGDVSRLTPRKILRISDVFVSHTHMDHFVGFDQVLRICLGRRSRLRLFGPPGFIDRVEHKLAAYTWNLVHNYENDFTLVVTEVDIDGQAHSASFRCRTAFERHDTGTRAIASSGLLEEDAFRIDAVTLDHRIPCLAFALHEKQHVNVWKNRLTELGLPIGPWLQELKAAVIGAQPDDTRFRVWWRDAGRLHERYFPLGELKAEIVRIVPGQKIVYVVDAVYHEENVKRIIDFAHEADILFIEAAFLHKDAQQAAEKYHLTAYQAGVLAHEAGVKRVVPFHFSPKYSNEPEQLRKEVEQAFGGRAAAQA